MTIGMNRHELRRRSTHEALRQAALKSFADKGFANVTVTQLAAEAGVTERTFFRHFPTKESVLFQDYETQLEWLAEALAQRPDSESLFDAVLASVAAFPHDLEVVRQAATARTELISAERIAGHLRVVQSSFAAVLTEFITKRNPGAPGIALAPRSPARRWPRLSLWQWSIGAATAVSRTSASWWRPVWIWSARVWRRWLSPRPAFQTRASRPRDRRAVPGIGDQPSV